MKTEEAYGLEPDPSIENVNASSRSVNDEEEELLSRSSVSNRPPARAGWVVLEEFVRDGFFYQLVRRPVLEPKSKGARLTKREQQAAAYARDGLSNKSIADALGVAPSTVGVLLFRAAAKLGTKSRRELVAAFSKLAERR